MRAWIVLALVLAIGGAGCAAIDDDERLPQTPDLTLLGLDLQLPATGPQEAAARLRVANPNAWAIAVEVVTFEIALNGTHLGRARAGRDVVVPAAGSREVSLRLAFPRHPAIASLAARQPSRGVGYAVFGQFKLVGRGVDLVPFRLEGRWPPP